MSPTSEENGTLKHNEPSGSIFEIGDLDLSRLLDKPRHINIERKRSFDERSFGEIGISSPRQFYRSSNNSSRIFDSLGGLHSPARSGISTPRSFTCVETHPIVSEAWLALQRSIVHFRGQPVGTIAALDHSSEELNYDQVYFPCALILIIIVIFIYMLKLSFFSFFRCLLETLFQVHWHF